MTGLLASVNSIDEALLVLAAGVDIIDLKQPAQGALGALDTKQVRQIVTKISGRSPVSATIGDLPMQPDSVFNAVKNMATTSVDYIKIGFFPGGDWPGTITRLSQLTEQGHRLIAVLFADTWPNLSVVKTLKKAGFCGVMLDTQDKQKGSLCSVMNISEISQFTNLAKKHNLLCGLAGSLSSTDIPELLPLQPDYLGFRGALCIQQQRTAALDHQAINNIRLSISSSLAPA